MKKCRNYIEKKNPKILKKRSDFLVSFWFFFENTPNLSNSFFFLGLCLWQFATFGHQHFSKKGKSCKCQYYWQFGLTWFWEFDLEVSEKYVCLLLFVRSCRLLFVAFQVVAPINYMLDTVPFNMHCYSLDWHPTDHVSFTDNAHLRKIAPTSKVQVGQSESLMLSFLPEMLLAKSKKI